MDVDNRRCNWCRRLCRYFGEDRQTHLCTRCQLWYRRNRCCQIKDALCSKSGNRPAFVCGPVWALVLDMGCGSIQELDNYVQGRIWQRILCGPAPDDEWSSDSECESLLENIMRVSQSPVPPGCSKLWKFWMLEIWGRSQNLVPQYNDSFRYTRILYIVIAFLGPFSESWVAHGSSWNRGWRFI